MSKPKRANHLPVETYSVKKSALKSDANLGKTTPAVSSRLTFPDVSGGKQVSRPSPKVIIPLKDQPVEIIAFDSEHFDIAPRRMKRKFKKKNANKHQPPLNTSSPGHAPLPSKTRRQQAVRDVKVLPATETGSACTSTETSLSPNACCRKLTDERDKMNKTYEPPSSEDSYGESDWGAAQSEASPDTDSANPLEHSDQSRVQVLTSRVRLANNARMDAGFSLPRHSGLPSEKAAKIKEEMQQTHQRCSTPPSLGGNLQNQILDDRGLVEITKEETEYQHQLRLMLNSESEMIARQRDLLEQRERFEAARLAWKGKGRASISTPRGNKVRNNMQSASPRKIIQVDSEPNNSGHEVDGSQNFGGATTPSLDLGLSDTPRRRPQGLESQEEAFQMHRAQNPQLPLDRLKIPNSNCQGYPKNASLHKTSQKSVPLDSIEVAPPITRQVHNKARVSRAKRRRSCSTSSVKVNGPPESQSDASQSQITKKSLPSEVTWISPRKRHQSLPAHVAASRYQSLPNRQTPRCRPSAALMPRHPLQEVSANVDSSHLSAKRIEEIFDKVIEKRQVRLVSATNPRTKNNSSARAQAIQRLGNSSNTKADRNRLYPELSRDVPFGERLSDEELIQVGRTINPYQRHRKAPYAFARGGMLTAGYNYLTRRDHGDNWNGDELRRVLRSRYPYGPTNEQGTRL